MSNRSNIDIVGNTVQAQNAGSGEGYVFITKLSGNTLQFRSIRAGDNINISQNDTEITISGTTGGGEGSGTVTSITAGAGLSGGTITTSGTISACFGTTTGTIAEGNDSRFHNPVTLNKTSNGLSLSIQELSMDLAGIANTGTVSPTTQTFGGLKTFNNGIVVGDTTSTTNGIIRYNTNDLQGRVNGSWVSLSKQPTVSGFQGIVVNSDAGNYDVCLNTAFTDDRYLYRYGDVNFCGAYIFCHSGTTGTMTISNSASNSFPFRVWNDGDGSLICLRYQSSTSQIRYSGNSLCFTHNKVAGFHFNCNITAPNFVLSSDISLKENISTPCISDSMINIRSFNLKSNPNEMRYGVIAQEIEPYYPELVNTDIHGIKSVKYIDLLIREVGYLKNKIHQLEQRINEQ